MVCKAGTESEIKIKGLLLRKSTVKCACVMGLLSKCSFSSLQAVLLLCDLQYLELTAKTTLAAPCRGLYAFSLPNRSLLKCRTEQKSVDSAARCHYRCTKLGFFPYNLHCFYKAIQCTRCFIIFISFILATEGRITLTLKSLFCLL